MGTYLNNFRSLFEEYWNVIIMAVFGFLFFLCGLYSVRFASLPGGLLFCWSAALLFQVSWYDMKHKGTPAYGSTITFAWADTSIPAWKKWAEVAWVVIFLLLFCWVVIESFSEGAPGTWCWGNCEGY